MPGTPAERNGEPVVIKVRDSYYAQLRGFEVELYGKQATVTRSGAVSTSFLFLDAGEWRTGGYVRWKMERHFHDFNILDELDEKLRSHYPVGVGTVQRADAPSLLPSVRLTATR